MNIRNLAIPLTVCILWLTPITVLSDEPAIKATPNDLQKAKDIKLQRIAVTWYQLPVTLNMQNGEVENGRLLMFEQGKFRLQSNEGIKEVPSAAVQSVTLKRQPKDLLLVGLFGVGGAGLLSAATSLTTDGNKQKVTTAAIIGSAGGLALGWKFFYQDITITIR